MGRIVLTLHSANLADYLWSRKADGETWEYVYFLDDLQAIDISLAQYNRMVGYGLNKIVQGFHVFDEDKSEALLSLLELGPEDAHPEPTETFDTLQVQLSALAGTDVLVGAKARAEQGILRTRLFGREPIGTCDLCKRKLPVGFLVAAHIKKRTSCAEAERKDFNVVMRACKLGCDELFERGYIYIDSAGLIQFSPDLEKATTDLKESAKALLGLPTVAFKAETSAYFEWHRKHLPRRLKAN